jgi:hypothetical protein
MATLKTTKKTVAKKPPPPKTPVTPATTAVGGAIPSDITGTNVGQVEAQLQKEYPAIFAFWMSDPQLKSIFESSVKNGTIAALQTGSKAAASKFGMALQPWISQHGPSMLAAESDKAANSGTYNSTLSNRQIYVKNIATQLGYSNLDSATINKIAELTFNTDYLETSFNTTAGQDRLKTYIANTAAATKLTGGDGAGGAQSIKQELLDYNNQMGNPYSSAWIDSAVASIVDPSKGVDAGTYKTMIKTSAANKYSGFADQINKGVTVQQVADPYISSMTKLLELPYDGSNWSSYINDPLVNKGLASTVNPDGTTQPMTNWQFEQTVRQDPRWAYTNNARDYVDGIAHQIGKDFGMVS